MKKSNRKGFTIVELVIVIAVIAILAAVLIPTFSNLIKKANESSDVQAVRQMNTFLAADGAVVATTPGRLLDVLKEGGFDAENYKPLVANRAFFWDRSLNQILYVDTTNGEVLFPKKVEANQATWYSLNGVYYGEDATIVLPETPAAEQTFAVANGADFIKVAEFVKKNQETYKGTITIELTNDINLMGADINFTDKGTTGLNVIIKSNNDTQRTITGLYISDEHAAAGHSADGTNRNDYGHSLFYYINNLTVENIAIEYSVIGGYKASQAGFFAGQVVGTATFTNVTVEHCTIQGNRKVGVLCGYTHGTLSFTNVKIDDCAVMSAWGEAGGVIGLVDSAQVATGNDVVIKDDIKVTNVSVSIANVEGFKKDTYTNGDVTYNVVQNENENGKMRVATANFAFVDVKGDGDQISTDKGSFSAYAALDTLDAFVNVKGTK